MNLSLFLFTLLLGELFIFLGALLAYHDHFFSVGQMKARGIEQGLPFIAHAGMWGDLVLVSPLAALIVAYYFREWSPSDWGMALIFGFAASVILHFLYTKIEIPESHVRNGGLTGAGGIHLLYMAGVFALLYLFYFCTPDISYPAFILASVLLVVHVILANHLILEITRPSWYGKHHFKDSLAVLSIVGTIILLAWRCYVLFG